MSRAVSVLAIMQEPFRKWIKVKYYTSFIGSKLPLELKYNKFFNTF